MKFKFPENFTFGIAGSAVQSEGAPFEDGKGIDVVNHYRKTRPEFYQHFDPDNSPDFYHRYPEDIQLLKELGVRGFRFSFSWARIYPDGPDKVNQAGIAYYHRLLDELLKNGIKPLFDLWHCDLPYWVIERGGTPSPQFSDWFLAYAGTCFQEFGDKVAYWSTVNEPQANVMACYAWGNCPPYEKDIKKSLQSCHNMIITHFKTVKLFKEMGCKGKIGLVSHYQLTYAASMREEDQKAAARDEAFYSLWFINPLFCGRYPDNGIFEYPYIKDNMPENYQKDLDENFIKSDYIGINYYTGYAVKYEKNDVMDYAVAPGGELGINTYSPYAVGLYDTLMDIHKRYDGVEIVITENGTSAPIKDEHDYEKELDDTYRVIYLREHLRSLVRAIDAGVNVTGYYPWAFIDVMENSKVHSPYGLIQIRYDKEDKPRIPKKSYYFYQEVIKKGEVY